MIPPISVVGDDRVRFPVVGHGAARLFSPVFAPQLIAGVPFVEVDMGRDGVAFPDRRTGLMRLFGTAYRLDYRKIVGFIRDISVLSDATYRSIRAPRALSDFPKGLEDPNLEFSGIYEDGWIADRAALWLSSPKQRRCMLVLRALVPVEATRKALHIYLTLDGRRIAAVDPRPGNLVIAVNLKGDGQRHEIGVTADPFFHLPGRDGRPASIRLQYVGFKSAGYLPSLDEAHDGA